jgi:hypothetical protein
VGFLGFLGIVFLLLLEFGTGYLLSSFSFESCTNLFFVGEWFLSYFRLPIAPLSAFSVPGLCVI